MLNRSFLFGRRWLPLCVALGIVTGISSAKSAEELEVIFEPGAAPDPSSVTVSVSSDLIGQAMDDSALSGSGFLIVDQISEPFGSAQLLDTQAILDDGMTFSLFNDLFVATAQPGAARVVMSNSGSAGQVVDGKFDQLGNEFRFEGEIFLSSENGPFDLSTVAPIQADLLGIELKNLGNQVTASFSIDLPFVAAFATPLGQIPLTIRIQGALDAIANLSAVGDFDNSGQLDADDIDQLHEAIRTQSADVRFDLTGDGVLDDEDSKMMVVELMKTSYGDADLDGLYDSTDLVKVLAVGEYEDGIPMNSGWRDGDWSGDGDFTSTDLVRSLSSGCFEVAECNGPRPATAVASVPEPAGAPLFGFALWIVTSARRRIRSRRARMGRIGFDR